jgi:hypothetical protein
VAVKVGVAQKVSPPQSDFGHGIFGMPQRFERQVLNLETLGLKLGSNQLGECMQAQRQQVGIRAIKAKAKLQKVCIRVAVRRRMRKLGRENLPNC